MKYINPNPANIVYFTQRNNTIYPMRSCFATSLAMALRNNGLQYTPTNGMQLDDHIMEMANGPEARKWADELGIKPNTPFLNEYWALMERLANELLKRNNMALKCRFSTNEGRESIVKQIDAGLMPVVGTLLTNKGHIVTVSGYTDTTLILCDPYGNANTGYKDMNGMNVVLDATLLPKLLKWVLLFSK